MKQNTFYCYNGKQRGDSPEVCCPLKNVVFTIHDLFVSRIEPNIPRCTPPRNSRGERSTTSATLSLQNGFISPSDYYPILSLLSVFGDNHPTAYAAYLFQKQTLRDSKNPQFVCEETHLEANHTITINYRLLVLTLHTGIVALAVQLNRGRPALLWNGLCSSTYVGHIGRFASR